MITNTKKTFRQDRLRKNPITWIIILLGSGFVFLLFVLPKYFDWQLKRTEIPKFISSIPVLEMEQVKLNETTKNKKEEFKLKSAPYRKKEKQVFPNDIDIVKIARVLELFSLQLQNANQYFELNKVNFGSKSKKTNSSQLNISLNFSTDLLNLKRFIKYIQKGEIPEIIEQTKETDITAYSFLKNNKVPIAHIDKLDFGPSKAKNENSKNNLNNLDVQMNIRLFFQ